MRKRVWRAWMPLMWLRAIPVSAQETRGNISGTPLLIAGDYEGRITSATAASPRFVQFVTRLNF